MKEMIGLLLFVAIISLVDGQLKGDILTDEQCIGVVCEQCYRCKEGTCVPDKSQPGCKKRDSEACDASQCPTSCHDCIANEEDEPRCVYRSGCCLTNDASLSCPTDPCKNWQDNCPAAAHCAMNPCSCSAKYYDKLFNEIDPSKCSVDASAASNPCAAINCGPCAKCVLANNTNQYTCELNTHCEEKRICSTARCPPGTACKLVDGRPQCRKETEKERLKACSTPPQTGTCKGFFRRYYYNRLLGKCLPFIYGGCGSNENNFRTEKECDRKCQGVPPCAMPSMSAPPPGCVYKDVMNPDGCPWPKLFCDEKPGLCPRWNEDTVSVCISNCTKDSDCDGPATKCCSSPCGASTCTQVAIVDDPEAHYIFE